MMAQTPYGGFMDYYKPTKQTKFGNKGNCLSAVVSTIFNIDIDDVPMFADDEMEWAFNFSVWMSEKFGKYVVPMKLGCIDDVHIFCDSMVITAINSDSPEIKRHAVITRSDKIIFDPMIGEVCKKIEDTMDATFMVIGDVRK